MNRTWIQQETVDLPPLQSIDEVVEVPAPLEEAASIPVEALMSEARWEMEKEQQIQVYKWLWIPSDGMEPTVQSVMMLQQTKSGKR